MCAQQYCAFMTDLAPVASIDTHAITNSTIYPRPLSSQLQIVQQQIRRTIGESCLLEPDRSCRCCPASALPPLSRAVDGLPGTHWVSPPLQLGSFFGLDFLSPVRIRSITVHVGHGFHSALVAEVLHSLSDAWVPLHTPPQATRLQTTNSGTGSTGSSGKADRFIMRFTYNVERELRDMWRLQVCTHRPLCCTLTCNGVGPSLRYFCCLMHYLQTGALHGVRLPVFSVQMVRFRSLKASPHPFVVYDIKYEVASK
jgi:hypothetical protein